MNATVTMVATARQNYNGVGVNSGQEFEATSEAEAADLVAVNMARRKFPKGRALPAAKPDANAGRTETRDLTADVPGDEPAPVDSASVRSTYSRRDMRARRS